MDTKIVAAAKWSVITEVLAKLITPLTNIILAHMCLHRRRLVYWQQL